MDFRYYDYLMGNSKYYMPALDDISKIYTVDTPKLWVENVGTHWVNLLPEEKEKYLSQGWKIHISSTIEEAQKILKIVSNYLFANKIPFKYVKNEFQLIVKNSKNSARESSGKFITIYPNSIDEFKKTLKELEVLLRNFDNGPYILSDRRWKESNIYYRYGGFIERRLDDGRLANK